MVTYANIDDLKVQHESVVAVLEQKRAAYLRRSDMVRLQVNALSGRCVMWRLCTVIVDFNGVSKRYVNDTVRLSACTGTDALHLLAPLYNIS